MSNTVKRSIAATIALGVVSLAAGSASAMPVVQQSHAATILQVSSWGDRVRGRTSSSTPALGYGYLYGDQADTYRRPPVYRHHDETYDQGAPYGYGAY